MEEYKKKLEENKNAIAKLISKKKELREEIKEIQKKIMGLEEKKISIILGGVKC